MGCSTAPILAVPVSLAFNFRDWPITNSTLGLSATFVPCCLFNRIGTRFRNQEVKSCGQDVGTRFLDWPWLISTVLYLLGWLLSWHFMCTPVFSTACGQKTTRTGWKLLWGYHGIAVLLLLCSNPIGPRNEKHSRYFGRRIPITR